MSFNIQTIQIIILKGILIALIYFEITKANDTTFFNIISFTLFYTLMCLGAFVVDIDTNVITTAFITKAVFTLVDDRIKKKDESS